jgi:hypothetical protein
VPLTSPTTPTPPKSLRLESESLFIVLFPPVKWRDISLPKTSLVSGYQFHPDKDGRDAPVKTVFFRSKNIISMSIIIP